MTYWESLLAAAPDDLRMFDGKRILLTGATGLVGGTIADMLIADSRAKGWTLNLLAVSRGAGRFWNVPEVTALQCDVTQSAETLPDADFILHAASNAHPMAFVADPVGTMNANLIGTRALLEHARRGGRLLFLSTGEVYGEDASCSFPDGFRETDFGRIDPMSPRACYPESKRAAETLCAAYAAQYHTDALVARLCYVYGANISEKNTRADAQFLRKAAAGEDIVLKSAGTQVRSYCYSADAAAGILTVLLRGETAQAYNVADGRSVSSIRNYAECLARLAGVSVRFELPDTAEQRGYSTVTRAVQNAEKLESLGWRAKFPLEEGLRITLETFRNRM